jgi:hypothetical protein
MGEDGGDVGCAEARGDGGEVGGGRTVTDGFKQVAALAEQDADSVEHKGDVLGHGGAGAIQWIGRGGGTVCARYVDFHGGYTNRMSEKVARIIFREAGGQTSESSMRCEEGLWAAGRRGH